MNSKNLVSLLPLLMLTGCVSTQHWTAAGGNRDAGIVKLSYQYPESQPVELSDAQAEQLADNRCNVWGYAQADVIPGQVRECGGTDGGRCSLWTVTREYQCSGDALTARQAAQQGAHPTAKGSAEGNVSARLTPYRVAR